MIGRQAMTYSGYLDVACRMVYGGNGPTGLWYNTGRCADWHVQMREMEDERIQARHSL